MLEKKLKTYLKKEKSKKINDLLWNLPYSSTDRSNLVNLNKLEIGKILTCKVKLENTHFLELETYQIRSLVRMKQVVSNWFILTVKKVI